MPNYTKLFNSIVTSTIWTEDDKTRIVWITMLAISDQHGEVQASIPGLARVAGVSVEATENAINKFMSPDAYSRTPDDEGRRIEKIDGGWALLNHGKYRLMASAADEKSNNAKRQKRHRDKANRNAKVTDSNGNVTHSNATVTVNADIVEAKADTEAKADQIHTPTIRDKESVRVIESPFVDLPKETKSTMDELMAKINNLRPSWIKLAHWTRDEMEQLRGGVASQMETLTSDDWQLLKDFLNSTQAGYFRPDQRKKLCESFSGIWSTCERWKTETKYRPTNNGKKSLIY